MGPYVQPQGLPQAGASASASPVTGIEAFLPVLAGILATQKQGGGGSIGMGGRDTRGMHVPIGPGFQQMYKSKEGSIAAGASTLIGNVLIANKNMGDPMGLPWWLGGTPKPGNPNFIGPVQPPAIPQAGQGRMGTMSEALVGPVQRAPVAAQAAANRQAAGSQAANVLASRQAAGDSGGGIMGMLGGLLGGGEGGGGLGSILGLLGGLLG